MGSPPATIRGARGAELVALLVLAFGIWLGFATSGLPSIVPATAPDSAFSAERALSDLKFISSEPHATGTVAHDRVRDYLVDRLRALGLEDVHVQSATGFNTLDGPIAATVANVVGRRRGTHPGSAILLLAHYDAVPRSFGAGDNGAGVVALLEAVRALRTTALTTDLMIVFTDAEEDGLLGAEAFVNLHPWARDVGVVLNFDGRGDQGPVFMFQTSPGNAPLIRAMAAGVPNARTNSLTGEVYRHLPSDTDLSIWLHSAFGVGAFNFAHVGGFTHYHTPMDNIASLDDRIIQQMGDYAVGIVRQLGRGPLGPMRSTDAVYFNAPLVGVVHYPASWALPLAVLGLVLTLSVIAFGVRRSPMSAASVRSGVALLALTLIVPVLLAYLGWRVVAWAHPAYRDILQGDPYNSRWYLLSFAAFTVSLAAALQRRYASSANVRELAVAPLILWGVLGVVIAVAMPGASYLFVWPLIGATLGLLFAPAFLALPLLVLWPALILSFEIALTAQLMPFFVFMTALVMSLLVVPLAGMGDLGRWLVRGAALTGVAAFLVAEFTSGFNATRKHPDSLLRLTDSDSAKAWWVSLDRAPDAWTSLALGPRPARRTFDDGWIGAPGGGLLASQAEPVSGDSGTVRILAMMSTPEGTRAHVHVDRRGSGEELALHVDSGRVVRRVIVNGRELMDGGADRYSPQYQMGRGGTLLRYFGVPEEGVDLWFTISGARPARLRVMSATEGLPALATGPLPARPVNFMSKPFVLTDVSVRIETVTLTGAKP